MKKMLVLFLMLSSYLPQAAASLTGGKNPPLHTEGNKIFPFEELTENDYSNLLVKNADGKTVTPNKTILNKLYDSSLYYKEGGDKEHCSISSEQVNKRYGPAIISCYWEGRHDQEAINLAKSKEIIAKNDAAFNMLDDAFKQLAGENANLRKKINNLERAAAAPKDPEIKDTSVVKKPTNKSKKPALTWIEFTWQAFKNISKDGSTNKTSWTGRGKQALLVFILLPSIITACGFGFYSMINHARSFFS